MCGINGIIFPKAGVNLIDEINEMNLALKHRGPDSSGIKCENNYGIGHTRLSIIDLSDAGNQPLLLDNGNSIVFNGEIYNYLELRKELIELGYSFNTNSDTEVIVKAYEAWGVDCLNKFNGMWAFILIDETNQKIFCARDRFGVKPFYYLTEDETIIISSEIKPLLKFLPKITANLEAILNYLVLDICDENAHTFFNGINKLLPSHYLLIDIKTKSKLIKEYYSLKSKRLVTTDPKKNYNKELDNIFSSSIRFRLRSDVKVGTCLSGGLDSSTIAAVAAINYKNSNSDNFRAFTASSGDKKNDEIDFAKLVVENSKLDWTVFKPQQDVFLEEIEEVIKTQEEPFRSPSIFMQYGIMKDSSRMGCKVLLDGQGGDEIFLGYERYFLFILKSNPIYKWGEVIRNISDNSKWNKTKVLIMYFYFRFPFLRKIWLKKKSFFLKRDLIKKVNWEYLNEFQANNLFDYQVNEITKFNLPELLRYEDKNSMKFAIETRLPFLDYNLVEFALNLPIEYKINGGWTKFILRKYSEKYLPKEISWRKVKIGFEHPENDWFANKEIFIGEIKKSQILNKIINIESIEKLGDTNLIWKLYNISRWESIFKISGVE